MVTEGRRARLAASPRFVIRVSSVLWHTCPFAPPGNVYWPMKAHHKRRAIAALLALAIPAFAATVQAWGDIGHRIDAELAWRQLDPSAKAEVTRLLKADGSDSLPDIASWPDKLRDMPGKEELG